MLEDMQADEIVGIEKDKIKLTRFNYKNDKVFWEEIKVRAETSTPIKTWWHNSLRFHARGSDSLVQVM